LLTRCLPRAPLFPYTTLFRSRLPGRNAEALAQAGDARLLAEADEVEAGDAGQRASALGELARDLEALCLGIGGALAARDDLGGQDRKSTRLNSSHRTTSYAVL